MTTPPPEVRPLHPLAGRTALVTGVSRRRGIGFAVAQRLAELGASVAIQHFAPHDADQPWGADDLDEVRAGIRSSLAEGVGFTDVSADLSDDAAVPSVLEVGLSLSGRVDILVCNHARSGSDGPLRTQTAESLDAHWLVNAKSTILLTRLFAEQFADTEVSEFAAPRVFWMTSGQVHGAMPEEVAYVASKAALAGLTPSVSKGLLERGIILNTINPGPVNTGYLDPETTDRELDGILEFVRSTPFKRFGAPTDPARLIGWLATDEGRWIVGQVLTSDGGFSL